MAKRGRPPKPTRLRILEGNRSKTPILPEPEPKGKPVRPENLPPIALAVWDAVVPKLVDLGIATDLDQIPLESMCKWFEIYYRCEAKALRDEASDRDVYAASNAYKMFDSIASKFGISPVDRTKLKGVGMKPSEADLKVKRFLS